MDVLLMLIVTAGLALLAWLFLAVRAVGLVESLCVAAAWCEAWARALLYRRHEFRRARRAVLARLDEVAPAEAEECYPAAEVTEGEFLIVEAER